MFGGGFGRVEDVNGIVEASRLWNEASKALILRSESLRVHQVSGYGTLIATLFLQSIRKALT